MRGRILTLALIATFTMPLAAQRRSDLKASGLLGQVRTVSSIVVIQLGNDSPNVSSQSRQTYTSEGWLLSDETSDAQGNLAFRQSHAYDASGALRESEMFRPGAAGAAPVREVQKWQDNTLSATLAYDAAGNLMSQTSDQDGRRLSPLPALSVTGVNLASKRTAHTGVHAGTKVTTSRRYDSAGREIEFDHFGADGALQRKEVSTYTDDQHGNWIRRVQEYFSADGRRTSAVVEERTITYY